MAVFFWTFAGKNFQTTEDEQIFLANGTAQENAKVNNAIKNIAICKNIYKHLYGTLADCLRQAFNYINKDQLKKIVNIYDKITFLMILTMNILHKIY